MKIPVPDLVKFPATEIVFPTTSPTPKSMAFTEVEEEAKFLKTWILVVPAAEEVFSRINEPVLYNRRSVPNY